MKGLRGVGILVAAALAAGSVAVARSAYGADQRGGSAASAQRPDRATLDLRDELVAKQMDLEAEYDKDEPDPARISALRKDIADIRARLRAAGDTYGVRSWRHGWGHGGPYRHAGWGGGCGCGGRW